MYLRESVSLRLPYSICSEHLSSRICDCRKACVSSRHVPNSNRDWHVFVTPTEQTDQCRASSTGPVHAKAARSRPEGRQARQYERRTLGRYRAAPSTKGFLQLRNSTINIIGTKLTNGLITWSDDVGFYPSMQRHYRRLTLNICSFCPSM
jgi:hypothetical protein